MSVGFPWLLVALALVLAPTAGGPVPPKRRRRGLPRLPLVGAAAGALLSLAVLPWPLGVAAALAAAPLGAAGAAALPRGRARVPDGSLPLALHLVAAALRAGQPVAAALRSAAPVSRGLAEATKQAAGLLQLGADPVEAWSAIPPDGPLGRVARTAVRSGTSGVRLAGALELTAHELRAEARVAALARAHRAGVAVLAPLGLCFLPAFVCLGIAPVVAGLLSSAGPALP